MNSPNHHYYLVTPKNKPVCVVADCYEEALEQFTVYLCEKGCTPNEAVLEEFVLSQEEFDLIQEVKV
jgi:hypothetical protein